MLKAVLFDFDGTIVDSLHLHLKAWRKTLAHYGKNPTDKEIIRDVFYNTYEEIVNKFDISDVDKFTNLYWSNIDAAFEKVKLHKNIVEILEWLKERDIKMVIVSFAESDKVRTHLDRLKLTKYFGFILGPNDVTHPKPHPEIVKKAMKRLGTKQDETLLIGDTEMDTKTGKNAGVLTALYIPETNKKYIDIEAYKKLDADFRFDNFLQLPSKISFLL